MKFTLSWLKDHLETDADLETISKRLTMNGLEVEHIEDRGAALKHFIAAEIIEATQHPNADRLQICKVDTGSGHLSIVCGAPNARAGIKVVLSRPGDVIPSTGQALKAGEIRGVKSEGMLCSAAELKLSDESAGIIELPAETKIGESIVEALGLNDPVIEIAITPNRADCASVRGIARDLAASGLGTLKSLTTKKIDAKFDSPKTVSIAANATKACLLFVGRSIRGVNNGPSPLWLQERLIAIGQRPRSALVDITNYITFDLGRPLHVFDAENLSGNLTIRFADHRETLAALNDKTYTLDPELLVIADEAQAQSLAGIVGGNETGCSDGTTSVFLEVALFDPIVIAKAGRKLQILSDARYRFERGVDPAFLFDAVEIATAMILDLCGGEASAITQAGAVPAWQRSIALRATRVQNLGGVSIEPLRQRHYLQAIGCDVVDTTNGYQVTPPSWRADIEGEADLVEEIMRLHGYDAIPSTPLPRTIAITQPALTPAQRRSSLAKRALASRGLDEAVTFAFMSSVTAKLFEEPDASLYLVNPISAELDVMRPTVIANLVEAVQRNKTRGIADVALFEVGPLYRRNAQIEVATIVRAGQAEPKTWQSAARGVDVFDVKADALALLQTFNLHPDAVQVDAKAPAHYHPGRAGTLRLGGNVLGYFGQLHPGLLDALKVDGGMVAAEIFIEAPPSPKKRGTERKLLVLSPFQPVARDFAFIVPKTISAESVVKAARGADRTLIQDVRLFDVYSGPGLAEDEKSIALSITLQAADKTLTEAELEAVSQGIIQAVAKATGGRLRG